jgi:inosose dehydratase
VYVDGEWTNPLLWPTELAKVKVITRFLAGCGAPVLACGGGPWQREPAGPDAYRELADRLRQLGDYTASHGIRTVYHPHIDTFIETREQLDRLMDVLDTSVVGLCIDPAHFHIKRDDPVGVFRTYADVIDYVHLKDCKGDEATRSGYDRYLAFAELGAGDIDLPGITDVLLAAEYPGIVTVELDYSDTADDSCARNAAYIREVLGLQLDAKLEASPS